MVKRILSIQWPGWLGSDMLSGVTDPRITDNAIDEIVARRWVKETLTSSASGVYAIASANPMKIRKLFRPPQEALAATITEPADSFPVASIREQLRRIWKDSLVAKGTLC